MCSSDLIKTTKTGKSRSVPICAVLREDLNHALRTADDGLVCPGEKGGFLAWNFWTTRVWHPALKETGINARAYDLRHTFVSLMLASGSPITEASAAAGHSKTSMTLDVYSHAYAQGHASPVPLDSAIRAARSELEATRRRHLRAV